MSNNNNNDLFSASLESIDSSRRVDKFQRFKNDFQRECNATLDNAQEWIKAELPIVTDYIDAIAVKDELKLSKTSSRRKHLLSALLFEKSLRESIENNQACKAAIMAIHMCNHMWQAKVELHGSLPSAAISNTESPSVSAIETYNDTREKILTTLIEKGEKLKKDSQIQSQIKSEIEAEEASKKSSNVPSLKPQQEKPSPTTSKPIFGNQKKIDLWSVEAEKAKQQKRFANVQNRKPKKKTNSVFSKVKSRIPLKRKNKGFADQIEEDRILDQTADDSLLDNPNRSAIMVSPGFSDSIDDSLIRARSEFSDDPNESGVTVHKILKAREHQRQAPGSNTIIMKLASSSGKKPGVKLSIPEQCQQAINTLTQQFPGYDMVAIRHMAAEKVGVSPQYIENLNILPEQM